MRIIEKFKKQHVIVQILDIVFIAVFIYEIITFPAMNETGLMIFLLFLILVCQWYFKKEDLS
jgi:hypothetical protein